MIPGFIDPFLHGIEWLLTPAAPLFSLYWHVRVRKKS